MTLECVVIPVIDSPLLASFIFHWGRKQTNCTRRERTKWERKKLRRHIFILP